MKISPTSQNNPSTTLDETQPTCQKSINSPTTLEFSPKKKEKGFANQITL